MSVALGEIKTAVLNTELGINLHQINFQIIHNEVAFYNVKIYIQRQNLIKAIFNTVLPKN